MIQVPVYYSSSASNLTGRFAARLHELDGRRVFNLTDAAVRRSIVPEPWVLLTPSYKAGNAHEVTLPASVRAFLRAPANRRRMIGIIGSGNRNFGRFYQAAARELALTSGRPILFEFELSGTPEDVRECARIMRELDAALEGRGPHPVRTHGVGAPGPAGAGPTGAGSAGAGSAGVAHGR